MNEVSTRRDKRVERIDRLVDTVLQSTDLYRVDTQIKGGHRTPSIDVFIDGDRGVNIDQCAGVSRALRAAIELDGLFEGSFKLDVSSPGLDRPLRLPRQYRRHLGRELKLQIATPGSDQPQSVTGKLIDAAEEGITLESTGEKLEFSFDQIERAVVTPTF